MCPPCFPPTIRDSAPPSLHRVPAGLVPRLRRYYEVLRLPTARPANLRYPSAGGDLPCACVRSTRPDAGPAAWSFGCGSPTPPFNDRKRPDLPGSWRTLVCLRPALGPRQDRRPRPYGAPTRPPPDTRRRLLQAMTFEAQSHGLGTGCLRFAGRVAPPPRQTRFPLPAKLYGVGLVTHRVRTKGFRDAPTCPLPRSDRISIRILPKLSSERRLVVTPRIWQKAVSSAYPAPRFRSFLIPRYYPARLPRR